MAKKTEQAIHCPYLETVGAASREPLSRPSHRHRCTATAPNQLISPRTQLAFCLIEQYAECPFFAAEAWKRVRPPEDIEEEPVEAPPWDLPAGES